MNKVKYDLEVDIEAYPEDFFIRHRLLYDSADKVLLIYGEMSYGVKSLVFHHKFYLIKRTKLLQSKSKQSRIVSVVCK
jgi:hypothetical protein